MFLHDGRLMDAVPRRPAGNRLGSTRVNAELVVEDGARDSCGIKGIPVSLDNARENVFVFRWN